MPTSAIVSWSNSAVARAHERLLEQHPARLRGAHAAGRGQERRLGAQQVGQPADEVGRVALRGRVAATAQDLDQRARRARPCTGCIASTIASSVALHEETPMTSPERTVCSRWICRRVAQLPVDAIRSSELTSTTSASWSPKRCLERELQVRVGAGGRAHRDAHDALLLGLAQEARDLGLRQAQPRGDLGLLDARLVVQAGDAGHEPQLVDARHSGGQPARRRVGAPCRQPA